MTLFKNLATLFVSFSILAVPTLALAHESSADLDTDVNASIGIAHPALTSGVLLGGNGDVIVNGATVDSSSGSTVTAHSSFGSSVLNWILNTGSTTKIMAAGGATTTAGIKSGDSISFAGLLSSLGSTITVDARAIRDWTKFPSSTTTATTSVEAGEHASPKNHGKHLGWFRNWFHFFGSENAQVSTTTH